METEETNGIVKAACSCSVLYFVSVAIISGLPAPVHTQFKAATASSINHFNHTTRLTTLPSSPNRKRYPGTVLKRMKFLVPLVEMPPLSAANG